MPFLGKQPTAGFASIVKDDLTGNGTTGPYTLSKQVANANDIAVFVGNVRQEPTDAYTVNGNQLTMTGAVSSSINFYVLHIAGTVESSVVPADGTISSAKLATNIAVSGNLDIGGVLTEPNKEYFQVDLTTDQAVADTTLATVDFGGNGTVIYDTKSNFDSSNDAYLLGSSDGVYMIHFNCGIASPTVTTEQIIYSRCAVEAATDGSSYSTLKGSAQQLRNSDGDNGGSVVLSGSFIYKATTSTTKIRMRTYTDSTGSPNYEISATNGNLTQNAGANLSDARATWLSIVRIA